MTRLLIAFAGVTLAALTGCNQNTAPGNDREAQVDPVPTAAASMSAAEALSGIATGAVQPETLSDADIASLGGKAGKCTIA